MESKESAEKPKKPGSMRLPSEGNSLWEMYHKLPRMEQRILKSELAEFGASWSTFLVDTKEDRLLDAIPFGRLDFYCSFFAQQGLDNLFDIARQERASC